MTTGHSCWRMFIILLTFLSFVASTGLLFIRDNYAVTWGWYRNTSAEISDLRPLWVDPAPWFDYMWIAVCAYHLLWLGYAISTICRRLYRDTYLYYSPPYMPMGIHVNVILAFGGQVAWSFCLDRLYILVAAVVVFLTFICSLIALGVAFVGLSHGMDELKNRGGMAEAGWTIGLLHNGLGLYAAWLLVLALLNLGAVLRYTVGWEQDLACTVILGILAGFILIWFIVDCCVIWRHSRFLFTPYLAFIFSLVAIMLQIWDPWGKFSIFVVAILGCCGLFLVIKVMTVCARRCRDSAGDNDSFQYYHGHEGDKQINMFHRGH